MDFDKPREIFYRFKQNLGKINPYMTFTDVAVHDLIDDYNQHGFSHLKVQCAKRNHRIYDKSDYDMSKILRFTHLAHIAYIQSCGEQTCSEIRKHELIKKHERFETKEGEKSYSDFAKGDFLRQTIFLIYAIDKKFTAEECKAKEGKLTDKEYSNYVSELDIKLLDYYRDIRNSEFHSKKEEKKYDFSQLDIELIKKQYTFIPNKEIDFTDVVLLSKAWQSCIKSLCENFIHVERDIIPLLNFEFEKYSLSRQRSKTISELKQNFFINDETIQKILNNHFSSDG